MALGFDRMNLSMVTLGFAEDGLIQGSDPCGGVLRGFPHMASLLHANSPSPLGRGCVDSAFLQALGPSAGTIGRS